MIDADGIRAVLREGRSVVATMRHELSPVSVGPVAVSGMLAEQLAKQLGVDSEPGAVVVGDSYQRAGCEVLVRVIAGEPTAEDDEAVRTADRHGVPVVIVQLWPQADWTPPFVLSPFVVECRAGESFPLREIGDRIVEASEHGPHLASRIPALNDASAHHIVRQAAIRSAVVSVVGADERAARPIIALEQLRMLARLRTAMSGRDPSADMPAIAGATATVVLAGFALRSLARAARDIVPVSVADSVIAAGGTWALAKALDALGSRLPPV